MSNIRATHVIPSIARQEGGPSEAVRELIIALQDCGVECSLVTSDKNLGPLDDETIELLQPRVAHFSRPLGAVNFATQLFAPLKETIARSDVVHIHSIDTYVSSVAMRIARRQRVPYILQPHGSLTSYQAARGRKRKWLYRTVMDRSSFDFVREVVVSSELEQTETLKSGLFPNAHMALVPLGVEPGLFDLDRTHVEPGRIAFISRVAPKKRLDLVLEAVSLLQDTSAQLVVAGRVDDDLGWKPIARAEELGIRDRVQFLGQIGQQQRRDLLASAAIYVLPSDDESFGIAPAEAMAAGVPTIVSERVGIADRTGLSESQVNFAVRGNSRELARRIDSLLSDPSAAEAAGMRGKRYATSHFNWKNAASQVADLYGRLSASPS